MITPETLSLPLRVEWRGVTAEYALKDAAGRVIASMTPGRLQEEMEYIAHAVNLHAALIDALQTASHDFDAMARLTKHAHPRTKMHAFYARDAIDLLLAQAGKKITHERAVVSSGKGGARNGNTRLTEAQVAEIRHLYATTRLTQKEIGKKFSVARCHVSNIVSKKSWKTAPTVHVEIIEESGDE